MNIYLIKSKVEKIKQAKKDLQNLYGIECDPFTNKIYFYFIILNNKKYIHKSSLEFIYTNADTYTYDVDPTLCPLVKEIVPVDVIPFLESYTGNLLPILLEANEYFLVYQYFNGDPVDSITQDEFFLLQAEHDRMELTPFYNSMTYNLARDINEIRLIDFKHFEPKDAKPFFVYFYNKDNSINMLYIEEGTELEPILTHLKQDYPVQNAQVITYIKRK
jgi:hypothetical protein